MASPFDEMANAVARIAQSTSTGEQNLRLTLALFAASVAMQPSIDPKMLLKAFDKFLEGSTSADNPTPMAALDLRTALTQALAAREAGGKG